MVNEFFREFQYLEWCEHGRRCLAGFMVGGRLDRKQSSVVLQTLSMRLASSRAKPYRKPRERRSADCQGCLHVDDGKRSRHSGIYARITLNAKTLNRQVENALADSRVLENLNSY